MIRLTIAVPLLSLAACATAQAAAPQPAASQPSASQPAASQAAPPATPASAPAVTAASESAPSLERIREEYRALQRIQAITGWYTATQGDPALGALTYLGHERLFTPAALAQVDRGLAQPGLAPQEQSALKFLRRALAGEFVGLAVAHFDDEFNDAEGAATVRVPFVDKPIAYRDVGLAIAKEPDADKRAQLYAASGAVIEQTLNPILARKEAAAQAAARTAGFADYVALSEDLRAVNLSELLAAGVGYLKATDALWKAELDRAARAELNTPREKLRLADLSRLWKAPKLAGLFEKDEELKLLFHFLGGIGLDFKTVAGTEVHIDDSLLPAKRPRAFVQPIDPPNDVRLSVKPTGGLDDVWTLFHEAGHAVHFAQVTVQPSENVQLGYGAPTEAFGEFFRHAFSDPRWLARFRDFRKAQGHAAPTNAELAATLRRTAMIEVLYLRRYAFAKIAYELRLHGRPLSEIAPAVALLPHPEKVQDGSDAALRSLFQQLFSLAVGFELSDAEANRFRVDVDDTFYSADYSRCFALAGMMHEGVRKK
ncbi:MAG: hypothetical protein JST92_26370, partial [Deltaproteobacteria bacterium]|nr:hypothetical protein [Deltaproteobacteria bacterium]